MKVLHVTFTDEEFAILKKNKRNSWHDYLLQIVTEKTPEEDESNG